jgi:GT2 family glycosyltransferase
MPDLKWEAELKKDPQLRIERLSVPSTTLTLNHCIFTSQADIILLLDDDAVPHFGWLEAHMSAFMDNTDLAYTAGREVRSTKEKPAFSIYARIMVESIAGLSIKKNKKLNGRIVGWLNWFGIMFGNFDRPGICLINSPRGCNMAVRRDFIVDIGGFNKAFRGNAWGFEADFGLRAAKEGKYGQYRGDAIVVHHECPSGGTREARKSQWFRDFLYNQKLVIRNIGPQAWLGSLPRIVKKFIWLVMNK